MREKCEPLFLILMKTICLKIFLILLLPLGTAAQTENCRLTPAEAPILHNFRLGMTPAEARAASGGKLKIKIKREGSFFQNYIEEKPPIFLESVRALFLRFYDGKLFQIEIFYQSPNSTVALPDFLAQNSAKLNLPFEFWTIERGKSKINCAGFSLAADVVLNPHLELTDEALKNRFDAAQKNK